MPTSASLVTNLPADFNTFGQGVDTSMQDLLGGTTGQILSKASNTNMDFTWITNDVGDITAVTAGTGISGGGTSGAVTITNSMATEIAAKGDLIVGTGSATFDNLGVGTNGHVLTADSTVSPTGLKWAAPAGGGKVLQVVYAQNSTDTNIESATFTDSGLSGTITPTLNTSKIAIFAVNIGEVYKSGGGIFGGMRLLRNSTTIMTSNVDGFFEISGDYAKISMVQNYVDSPATTSAVTYKTQGCGTTSAVRLRFGYDGSIDTMILMEIGA